MSDVFDPYRKWLGIPPEEQPPDHYRLLGIPRFESDPDVIENAAHRQMAYVRTFQTGKHSAESQKLLNELASAKVCLLTSTKKETYDESLRRQTAAASTPAPSPAPAPVSAAATVPVATPAIAATAGATPPTGPADSPPATDAAAAAPPPARPAPRVVPKPATAKSGSSVRTSAPAARTAKPSATRTKALRRPWLWIPVASSLAAVLLIVVLVVLFSNGKDEGETAGGKPAVGDDLAQRAKKSVDAGRTNRTSPKPTFTASNDDDRPSAPNLNGARTPPVDREERMRQQIGALRDAFSRRDLSRSRQLIAVASRPARNSRWREEVEQLQVLSQYLEEFWSSVERGAHRVQDQLEYGELSIEELRKRKADKLKAQAAPAPANEDGERPANPKDDDQSDEDPPQGDKPSGDEPDGAKPDGEQADADKPDKAADKPEGDASGEDQPRERPESIRVRLFDRAMEIVEVGSGLVKVKSDGEVRDVQLRDLDSLDAAALAVHSLKSDDLFGRVYVVAFLCIDGRGDRAENLRVARQLWEQLTADPTASYPYLERELRRAESAEPAAAAGSDRSDAEESP